MKRFYPEVIPHDKKDKKLGELSTELLFHELGGDELVNEFAKEILALIKKHERAMLQGVIRYIENNPDFYVDGDNFGNMYENTGIIKSYLYKILTKLKDPDGPKEVEK